MRLGYTATLNVLLLVALHALGDIDVTDSLFGHIVYFKNHKSESWLGLTEDHETMTIDIGEDNIHFYDPKLGLRNKFSKPADAPKYKIVENNIKIDDNGGDIANAPPEPSRGSFSGRQVADVNYLQDRNVNPIRFWKRNKNETFNKEMQWRVVCADDSMEDCSIMNVRYQEFLFSDGPNATVGTKPGCNEVDSEECPRECERNEDCKGRGQCVSCQNNECRVSEECCSCLSCPCDELFTDPESNAVCQKEIKCGLCGEHCSDVTDPCPIQDNRVCVKPVEPPKVNVTEPLAPEFRWKVLVPGFFSNITVIHESGCNVRDEDEYERIRFRRGIVMHEGASWNLSATVADDVWTRVEMGGIQGEGAGRWKEELENTGTWGVEGIEHEAITIPYGHKAIVKQLQGKYGNPLDPVYTVYGDIDVVEIKACEELVRPDCLPDDGSEPPECPMYPKHHWQYEPIEVKFRPHETDCSLYWECIDPKVDEKGKVVAMARHCLKQCGKFAGIRATTFDWGFGKGSMECIWDADCSYVNQTSRPERPATTTTTTTTRSTAKTTTTVEATTITTTVKSTTTTTTTSTTTTTTSSTAMSCPGSDIPCDSSNLSRLYPTEPCGKTYCKCDNNGPVIMDCPDVTAFHPSDPGFGFCDWTWNNPKCPDFGKSRLGQGQIHFRNN